VPYISQGSVDTHLRCGGIVNMSHLLNVKVKAFWRTVNILPKLRQE